MIKAVALGLLCLAMSPRQDGAADPVASIIDAYFEARWKDQGLTPNSSADDYEYLRRATLDILGRLPRPEEIRSFVTDASPAKRAAAADRLQASPEAAKYFTDRWLRLLFNYRFEETDPSKVDFPAFTAWLEKAWSGSMPYDAFAAALIAPRGELEDKPEANYILRYLDPKEPPINLANRTTRVFLGIQMQCAQCHDHPYEKITQDEFWGVTAHFGSLKKKTRKTFDGVKTKLSQELPATVKMVVSDVEKPVEVAPKFFDGTSPGKDEFPVDVLAKKVLAYKEQRFARAGVNRTWAHLMGKGFVEPLDRFSDTVRPLHGPLLEKLSADFAANGHSMRRLQRGILLSKAYGLSSKRSEAPESEFTYKLLKPQDPPQFLNNFVWALNLDQFFDQMYQQLLGNKDLPESYRNAAVFRLYLTTFVQKTLAPGGRAPEEMPYTGSVQLALKLMNGHDLQGLMKAGWGRLAEILKGSPTPEDRVASIYLALLSRPATAVEIGRAQDYLKRKRGENSAYEDLYWMVLNSTEFFFNH